MRSCYAPAVLVFAREVFVCKCSTEVPRQDPNATGPAKEVAWHGGSEKDFAKLDREHHHAEHLDDFRVRLERGEYWMIGTIGGEIATYTWLTNPDKAIYPSLPGCEIALSPETGYGYDAWTPPELRGKGLRRVGFLEELNILREHFGHNWEASFFVRYQLEGATRSLAKVGIVIEPLWRVSLNRDRSLAAECLAEGDDSAVPTFLETGESSR